MNMLGHYYYFLAVLFLVRAFSQDSLPFSILFTFLQTLLDFAYLLDDFCGYFRIKEGYLNTSPLLNFFDQPKGHFSMREVFSLSVSSEVIFFFIYTFLACLSKRYYV